MIIMPIYNTVELEPIIMRCIGSLRNITFRPLCLIDDASPKRVEVDLVDDDVLIKNMENLGYTGSVNVGLKYAMGKKDKVFVVANDDLYFDELDLDWVLDCKENTIVSPKTTDEGEGDMFGSLWAVHRTVIDKIGYLNEKLTHFFSDTEYYHRAKWNGIHIVKRDDVIVGHVGSATYNTIPQRNEYYESNKKDYHNMV